MVNGQLYKTGLNAAKFVMEENQHYKECAYHLGQEECLAKAKILLQNRNLYLIVRCNTQPCPSTIEIDGDTENLAPIVKMTKISNRFQRYELCIIKEGDMQMSVSS